MDLRLLIRVLWRFRLLVVTGLFVALLLSFLSIVSVRFVDGTPKLQYRQNEVWVSHATLLVTQSGFPLGRSILDEVVPVQAEDGAEPTYVPRFADNNHFVQLAILYSRIAMSDTVRQEMRKQGPLRGVIRAEPLVNDISGSALPMIDIAGLGTSPQSAVSLAARGSAALRNYIREEQERNAIPPEKRVLIFEVNQPRRVVLLTPRSKTRPMFIFLGLMTLVVGLAFALENLRPRQANPDGGLKATPLPDGERRQQAKSAAADEAATRYG